MTAMVAAMSLCCCCAANNPSDNIRTAQNFVQPDVKASPDLFVWEDTCNVYVGSSSEADYRYWFDPFWVRAEPYRTVLCPGQSAEVGVHVRNFRKTRQKHRIEIHTPPGIVAEPAALEGELEAESRKGFPIRLKATAEAGKGVKIVALDVTLDGHRYGERFDLVVGIGSIDDAEPMMPNLDGENQ